MYLKFRRNDARDWSVTQVGGFKFYWGITCPWFGIWFSLTPIPTPEKQAVKNQRRASGVYELGRMS